MKSSRVRWQDIADSLRHAIESGALAPETRISSETDLASAWNVSRMTANRALNALREEGLVVRQPRSGTFVTGKSRQRLRFVAAILPAVSGTMGMNLMHGIRAALSPDFHLIFCATSSEPEKEAAYLLQMQREAAGILVVPTGAPQNLPLFRQIQERAYPLVCIDRLPQGVALDAVMTDNRCATSEALAYLHRKGHQRIAHFSMHAFEISSIRERYEAYLDFMERLGVAAPERFVRFFPSYLDRSAAATTVQAMRDALIALRGSPEPVTAVLCVNEHYRAPLADLCVRMGIAVPEDLEIVSFDEPSNLSPYFHHDDHRILQRFPEIGALAAERLQRRLAGERLPAETLYLRADFLPAGRDIVDRSLVAERAQGQPALSGA